MYAAPARELDAFWQGLRGHMLREGLTDVPSSLDIPDDPYAHWVSPHLLVSQTCGYPLTTSLSGRVHYVGTPRYRAAGCEGASYSSAIVIRADEPATRLAAMAGRRVAFNAPDSQSGYNALRAIVAPLSQNRRFFSESIETGAHRLSVEAVRTGSADLAAIDAVTFALLWRDHPEEVRALKVLAMTALVPGLPLVTALTTSLEDIERLRTAWVAACADPALGTSRAGLLLDGFEVLPLDAYDVIPAMQHRAVSLGYPTLS